MSQESNTVRKDFELSENTASSPDSAINDSFETNDQSKDEDEISESTKDSDSFVTISDVSFTSSDNEEDTRIKNAECFGINPTFKFTPIVSNLDKEKPKSIEMVGILASSFEDWCKKESNKKVIK